MARITPQEAVGKAAAYLTQITGIVAGMTVEEVQLSDDANSWLITLGHPDQASQASVFSPQVKAYKMIKVAVEGGDVSEMTIRKF